jgi:hypothetical protein
MKKEDLDKLLNPFGPKEQTPFYQMGTGVQQPKKQELTVDKVLEEKIQQKPIEQKLPLAQVMPKIEQEVATIDAKTEQKPELRKKLYENLINKYGMDKREELLAKFEEQNKGFNWAAFAAGIGTTLQGKGGSGAADIVNMQRAQQKGQLEEFDKTKAGLESDIAKADAQAQADELRDPNSVLSRQLQQSISSMVPGRDFSKFNAEQLTKVFPFLQAEANALAAREASAKTEREKQQEMLRMTRGGDPIRTQVLELAANDKERDEALKEADFVKTSQKTIDNLTTLFDRAQKGEIDMGTFSKLANTTLSEYRRIAAESGLPAKSIGYVQRLGENLFKGQKTFAKDDLETAVLGIKTLTENNTKLLNSLGINYKLNSVVDAIPNQQVGRAPKNLADAPRQDRPIRPGQVIRGADGKQYRVINSRGDLEPI